MRKKPTSANLTDPKQTTKRIYRQLVKTRLKATRVIVQETDLCIYADRDVSTSAKEAVIRQRGYMENYMRRHPDFAPSLNPLPMDDLAPKIVKDMMDAGRKAQVGPMAAVAGAVAEHVGNDLLAYTDEVIVENGGDIFIKKSESVTVGIFAGKSPLSLKIGLKIAPGRTPVSVCTSSGSIGHSLSFGKADAVCVVAGKCALADAAATAIGNQVKRKTDINSAIGFGRKIDGVAGIVIICEDQIGLWGDIETVPLEVKKG